MKLLILALIGLLLEALITLPSIGIYLEEIPNSTVALKYTGAVLFSLVALEGFFLLRRKTSQAEEHEQLIKEHDKLVKMSESFASREDKYIQLESQAATITSELTKLRAEIEEKSTQINQLKILLSEKEKLISEFKEKLAQDSEQDRYSEIVSFIGMLQEKGRLLDFLMEDISQYSNEQIGGAARVLHQGCSEIIKDHFKMNPLSDHNEGTEINLHSDTNFDEYKLSGNVNDTPPYNGKILHRGWSATEINLPKPSKNLYADRRAILSPIQVEVN